MEQLLSCRFSTDAAYIKLNFVEGCTIPIDCTAMEDKVSKNMRQCSVLDYLVFNPNRLC